MMECRLIIAGSRDFNDYEFLKTKVKEFIETSLKEFTSFEIVSGKAKGADTLGERFAKEFNYKIKEFPANWNKYGNAAGPIRNGEMAKYGNACIIFRKNNSGGSTNMYKLAKHNKLIVKIYDV